MQKIEYLFKKGAFWQWVGSYIYIGNTLQQGLAAAVVDYSNLSIHYSQNKKKQTNKPLLRQISYLESDSSEENTDHSKWRFYVGQLSFFKHHCEYCEYCK